MAELDKVIKGLQCCNSPNNHEECPYNGAEHYNICTHKLLNDAIALLKAKQPRVLNLNEIHRGMVVWLEDIDKPDVILAIGGSSAGGAKCFVTQDGRSIAPLDEDYRKRWRCWTSRPTDAQREATPWES